MKHLTIALVSDSVPPFNKGGKETRIHHLSRQLAALGQDVQIYSMKWWQGADTTVVDSITYHALSKFYPLYSGERRSIKQGLLFGLACLKMVRYDFDLLEVDHMPYFPLYACKIVSLIKRKPLYATWHEVWGRGYWTEYLGGLKGRVAWWIEAFSVRLPDHITAVSAHTEKQLRSMLHYTGPLSLISNGIDYYKIAAIKPAATSPDVLFAGRLLAHKHVDLLVRAVALLKKDFPTISCTIIGEGPEHQRIAALIRELGLGEHIHMLGFLESHDDVYAYMKSARVFVLPSSREGFGITVLEAYACGTPAVTVRHRDNAAQYLIPEGYGAVVELTAEAVADGIRGFLGTQPAAADAASYDWGFAAQKLMEVYPS